MLVFERAMTRIAGQSGKESNAEMRCRLARPVEVTSNRGAMEVKWRWTVNISHTATSAGMNTFDGAVCWTG